MCAFSDLELFAVVHHHWAMTLLNDTDGNPRFRWLSIAWLLVLSSLGLTIAGCEWTPSKPTKIQSCGIEEGEYNGRLLRVRTTCFDEIQPVFLKVSQGQIEINREESGEFGVRYTGLYSAER